ncbi:hypothetical protein AB0D04_06805 [Streptomyces sp. NPDC048483]|uniref:hypothetical protein n=1 Tax=Streptomyces sp. NPDC048483 TaxID=3154927 RepID=UPI00341978E2
MTSGSTTPYDHRGAQLLALLLGGAAPGDAGRIRHRLGEAEPRYLTWVRLGDEARAQAIADPDARVRREVVRADGLTEDDLTALLERPDPVADQAVYEHPAALPWMRRRILEPGRHPDPTALKPLLDRIRATVQDPPGLAHFVAAAVVSDVPEVAEYALRTRGPALTTAEQLRGVLSLLPHPERLRALLDSPADNASTALLRTPVAELARAALGTEDGGERLRAAVTDAEGAEGLIAGLRAGEESGPVWRRTLDWDALLTAHQEASLPESAVGALAAHPGCPEPLLADLYRAHPAAVADAARPCPAVLRAAAHTPGHPELARLAAALDRADEATGSAVLDAVSPARTAVSTLVELGTGAPAAPLRALLRRHLGADPRRWATLRTALSRYQGTLADLLADIADGTVPEPAPTAKVPALTKPYRYLLYAAEPDDLRDLLPHLPDELRHALLGKGALPAHALDTALAAADPRAWAAIGGNVALGARDLRRLTEGDEPTVNAAVYLNQKATLSLRRAIASGVPRTPGRSDLLPLDAGLRAALLAAKDKFLLTPAVTSGDPELVHRAWRHLPDAALRFAVVRVWERGGPDAVRRLVGLLPEAVQGWQLVQDTLAALDHRDGVARLRAGMEPYEDTGRLPGLFAQPRGRNATRRLMRTIVHEPYAYDFARLIAAHHRHTFQPEPLEELLRHEDVDDEIRWALTAARPQREADDAQDGAFEPIAYLRAASWPGPSRWFTDAVRQGSLAAERLVDTARPAAAVVASLHENWHASQVTAARRHAIGLAHEHLAGHPEAWVVALNLLGTFTGTLAELITVAAQVAGPRPDAEELARLDASRHAADARAAAQEPAPAPPSKQPRYVDRHRLDRTLDTEAAVTAADLLRSLVPHAPLPTDPVVLKKLADTDSSRIPGHRHPGWLDEACHAHGTPEAAELLASRKGPAYQHFDGSDRGATKELAACRTGHIAPSEMVARRPAAELAPLPDAWLKRGRVAAQLRAVRRLAADRLGADPGRWLRALVAMDTEWAERPFAELLDHADTDDADGAARTAPLTLTPAAAGLLLHADADALAAVMTQLACGATATLTEKACARNHVTAALVDHVFARGDRTALLTLAGNTYAARCHPDLRWRLLTLDDTALNYAMYARSPVEIRRVILSRRPQGRAVTGPDDLLPLAPELRTRLRVSLGKSSLQDDRLAVEAADSHVVEGALASFGTQLPLLDHLLAARNSLRHGGPDHLRSLIDRGLLSTGAAKAATKALAAPDPDAVLTARLDRELSMERLVTRLRTCKRYLEEHKILGLPYVRDWDVLLRAQEEKPFPRAAWDALRGLPDAPEEVASASLDGALARSSPRLARALIAVPGRSDRREEFGVTLDSLLERGLLTPGDLVHRAEGANTVLHYLAEASLRQELPAPMRTAVQDATKELAALAAQHLGTDHAAWQRLFAAITGYDTNWPMPGSPVTVGALLAHAAKEPLG